MLDGRRSAAALYSGRLSAAPGRTIGLERLFTFTAATARPWIAKGRTADPDGKKVAAETHKDGRIVAEHGVVSAHMNATDSSQIK